MRRSLLPVLMMAFVLVLGACIGAPSREPVQVTVADIAPLAGEGLEVQMMIKLRVQNPNDEPVEYDGCFVKMVVQDKTFATGVSDARGTIPRFGESTLQVPVTVSTLRMLAHALTLLDGQPIDKISYKLEGELHSPSSGSTKFQASGEFAAPGGGN